VNEDIKTLLGVDDVTGDEIDIKIASIVSATASRLKLLLGGVDTVPDCLAYIVNEVSIIRFNRIGSEGLSSHSVEGESMAFQADDFAGYREDIQAYLDAQVAPSSSRGKVRFI